jgi:hypothetical protein
MVVALRPMNVAGMGLLSMFIITLLGTTVASAEESRFLPSLSAIYIITLPVMGTVVLLIVLVPEMLGRRYHRERPAFHIANILAASSIITFLTARGISYAIMPGLNTTVNLSVLGVLSLLISTGLFARYFMIPIPWAAVAGSAIAVITVSLALVVIETPLATIERVIDMLLYSLPLWLLVWVGLLLLETAKYHVVPNDDHKGPDRPGIRVTRRMLRLGELLLMNFAIALGIGLVRL